MSEIRAVEVAAGLVFRSNRLLIAQRLPGRHLEGLWEFPGGKREVGETWEDCLRRELREELAIEVDFRRWWLEVTHSYAERTVHLRFGICCWHSGEPVTRECADFAWTTLEELGGYQFPEADAGVINRLPELAEFYEKSF